MAMPPGRARSACQGRRRFRRSPALGHGRLEHRALGQARAHPPADRDQHRREQERHAPAPGEEVVRRSARRPSPPARRRPADCRPARPPAASRPRCRAAWRRRTRRPSAPRRPIRRPPRSPARAAAAPAAAARRRRSGRRSAAGRSGVLETPISTRLSISRRLRPMRSPKWPNTSPPIGRATKPSA